MVGETVQIPLKSIIEWRTVLECVMRYDGDRSGLLADICEELRAAEQTEAKPVEIIRVPMPEYNPYDVAFTKTSNDISTSEPMPDNTTITVSESKPESQTKIMRAWSDDEVSILRCASSKAQALEYYKLSDFAGKRTDYAVEQKYDKVRSSRVKVGTCVQVMRHGNAFCDHFGTIEKIAESKTKCLVRLDSAKTSVTEFNISDLMVVDND